MKNDILMGTVGEVTDSILDEIVVTPTLGYVPG